MKTLKTKYNKVLRRYYKAVKWMDDEARTEAEINKYYGEFQKILEQLNAIIRELIKNGYKPTCNEILEGFNDN
ncbi:hypothetical protein [Caminicella sporogenes]|uniref:hypothetical protein n=1 Tax=Caminicella sporogenes TaxID=166485 RepID=UPI0025415F38|nr:hypothetical protein [Caminicella sporogenes]WIF95155.1 hypothetical protein QNI18_00515 [Caminicella sporogenes]